MRKNIYKVCGIQEPSDALHAYQQGADLIGIIFAPKSSRCVTAARARDIIHHVREEKVDSASSLLPPSIATQAEASIASYFQVAAGRLKAWDYSNSPLFVGVFMNQTAEEINHAVATAGLDLVQLHGSEGFAFASQIDVPVIRVVHVKPETTSSSILEQVTETKNIVAILLDTSGAGGQGGTGKVFDWKVAAEVNKTVPVFVAGGLKPNNALSAISTVHPLGLDVSSGLETDGRKDKEKISQFLVFRPSRMSS